MAILPKGSESDFDEIAAKHDGLARHANRQAPTMRGNQTKTQCHEKINTCGRQTLFA
jgi:hypothetical protein